MEKEEERERTRTLNRVVISAYSRRRASGMLDELVEC